MHLLIDTLNASRQALTTTLLVGSGALIVLLGTFALWQRRRRYLDRLAEREHVQRALERRVAERTADLQTTNAQLAEQVTERTQAEHDLRQTQTELVQAGKLAALGQMSTALSHEFNQPLAAIRTYAENARAFIDRDQTARANENLDRIARLTERMAQLSKHLTAFARKPKDTVSAVSLESTLAETLELLRARIEAADAEVKITGAKHVMVMGGQTRLQHVFMNLVGNALDAAAHDGVAPRIDIDILTEDAEVAVVVSDNGSGIASDDIAKVFDPFFSRKDPGKGLGLGLSISYNIVRDFGGSLSAANRVGGGAVFTVRLRSAMADMEAAE